MDISAPLLIRSLPRLVDQTPRMGGVREWLVNGSYTIESQSGGLKLVNVQASEFLPYLLFDYARFALASYESLASSFKPYYNARALAWPFLNQYYSAFFSGHAVLRSQGLGIVRLGDQQTNILQPLAQAVISPNYSVGGGNYDFHFELDGPAIGTLVIRKRQQSATHEDFWIYFYAFLTAFSADLLRNGAANAALAAARIDELQTLLRGPDNSRGQWLSIMRNDLNYQHKFGAWFPFHNHESSTGPKVNIFKQNNSAIVLTHNPKKTPLTAFRAAICFVSLLNVDLAKQLRGRAASRNSQFCKEWDRLANVLHS